MTQTATHASPQTAPNGRDKSNREMVTEMVDDVADAAKRVADDISAQGTAAVAQAQRNVEDAHGSFADAVRRNPTASVLGAAGIGLLLGLALRGRN